MTACPTLMMSNPAAAISVGGGASGRWNDDSTDQN
jgi:hypothetical protein